MICQLFVLKKAIAMPPVLEPLFCPCCTPTILHALSQSGSQVLSQTLLFLGSGSLSAVIGLSENLGENLGENLSTQK
jgi:hypothetical protein